MSINEQMTEMQSNAVEQMKSVQTQVAELNERIADSIVNAMPEVPTPFAEYLPKPTAMVANYFEYMTEVRSANREFVERMVKAWEPQPTSAAK